MRSKSSGDASSSLFGGAPASLAASSCAASEAGTSSRSEVPRSTEKDSKCPRELGVIARNARTLLGHVDDLLDVSKLEAGAMKVCSVELDLARFVASAAQLRPGGAGSDDADAVTSHLCLLQRGR